MPRLSTNQEAFERRQRIIGRILNGESPKEIAYDETMAASTVYRMTWEEGFSNQLLTKDEWQHILKRRTQKREVV